MKILLITQHWKPENSVAQRRWSWLAKVVGSQGWDLEVLVPRVASEETAREGKSPGASDAVPVHRVGMAPRRGSLLIKTASQAVMAAEMLAWFLLHGRKMKYDLIVGTVPALPIAPLTWIASKISGTNYVVDLRDAWPDLLENSADWNRSTASEHPARVWGYAKLGRERLISLARLVIDFVLKRADGIIVTSDHLATSIAQRMGADRRGRRDNIGLVRNVFPTDSKARPNHPKGSLHRPLRVLYAGTFGRAQNLRNAVEAAALAGENGLEVEIRFVGSGDARSAIEKFAFEKGVSVQFEDAVPSHRLSQHYLWADTALVHLTDWQALSMTVPSKTYELMTLGVHISGVVAGETKELIESLKAGNAVEPEKPHLLAELWVDLARGKLPLDTSGDAALWVEHQRNCVAPQEFLRVISEGVG